MRYFVDWTEAALDALADAWMQAADPNAVRNASNRVDAELAHDPLGKGVDFYGDRLFIADGLHVAYRVDAS